MFIKWFPWKYIVRRVARARGFVDPISILSRMHQFAEPSEVTAPVELLRAGVVFHARGLMNAGSIQHNRDWIWPFWVERQFDPSDDAFLPRAFSITHVNLTHRNWTAVGVPGCDHLPIVDPRGLLTPFWDGWSLDGWIFQKDGVRLIPSRHRTVHQEMQFHDGLAVTTECQTGTTMLRSTAEVVRDDSGQATVCQQWQAESREPAWLVLSVRPYNPEGVSFIHDIHLHDDSCGWKIGDHGRARFSQAADEHFTSDYKHGDVSALIWNEGAKSVSCPVGMATAAAVFKIEPGAAREVTINVPLDEQQHRHWMIGHGDQDSRPRTGGDLLKAGKRNHETAAKDWSEELSDVAELDVPDERMRTLHDIALRTVVLHTPGEVYPGPYTYKRFWVRDTVFILNAALSVGLHERTAHALPHLLLRQNARGYFHSQDGEWDANGQALWLLERYSQLAHQELPENWRSVIRRAADWIQRKRLPDDPKLAAAGLLPAGFSAEHLGPNDYYFWDDFWSVAGLQAASRMMRSFKDESRAAAYQKTAGELQAAIDRSLQRTDYMRSSFAYPAAPERRMDAGAIGSVVASYPLQLMAPDDERFRGTIEFLLDNCMVEGGFFQDMIHSGINPYLTLHIAQAMMRSGDARCFELIHTVAKLASPTGQWPEAIHPKTLGGCMGDGQHVWAAAEWLMAIRNMFVREEGESLVIGSGIPAHWHYSAVKLSYGPTWTPWGRVKVEIQVTSDKAEVTWDALWHRTPPQVHIAIPCYHMAGVDMSTANGRVTVQANHSCPEFVPTNESHV